VAYYRPGDKPHAAGHNLNIGCGNYDNR
jgi:hypothetical protein